MRTILVILCACCLATGCGDTQQPLKPSPLHYAQINSKQCTSNLLPVQTPSSRPRRPSQKAPTALALTECRKGKLS